MKNLFFFFLLPGILAAQNTDRVAFLRLALADSANVPHVSSLELEYYSLTGTFFYGPTFTSHARITNGQWQVGEEVMNIAGDGYCTNCLKPVWLIARTPTLLMFTSYPFTASCVSDATRAYKNAIIWYTKDAAGNWISETGRVLKRLK